MGERGSVSVIAAAVLGLVAVLAAFGADVTRAAAGRARAQAAADAAALAAAQELFVPTGRSPAVVAAEYAERSGAELVECRCEGDEALVTVELEVSLPLIGGSRRISARARAVSNGPSGAAGLQAWFVSRLSCLFQRVPGLRIVSGFRTWQEQARLHRLRPDLAAPPGRSMHEVGLAADLGFASAAARAEAHASAAGCGVSFPVVHEPWHAEPA